MGYGSLALRHRFFAFQMLVDLTPELWQIVRESEGARAAAIIAATQVGP